MLSHITIPDSVTEIGDFVFSQCDSLIKINIPFNLTSLGNCAFFQCSSLNEVNIPSSLKKIGKSVFLGTRINIESLPKEFQNQDNQECNLY